MKKNTQYITRTSLAGQLTYFQMLISSGVLLLAACAFIGLYGVMTWKEMLNQLKVKAQLISYSLEAPIKFADQEEAEKVLLGLKKDASILGALVYTRDNIVFISYGNSIKSQANESQKKADGVIKVGGYDHLIYSHAIVDDEGNRIGQLYLKQDLGVIKSLITSFLYATVAIFFWGLLFSFVFARFSANVISRPLRWIISTAKRVSETGDYSLRVNESEKWSKIEEINSLTQEFNYMLKQIQSRDKEIKEKQNQLVQSGKLAALGEMSAGVAHELNNPLHFVKGFNQRIKAVYNDHEVVAYDQVSTYITKINENCERMRKIIRHFRDFSRQEELKLEPIEVNKVVDQSFILLNEQLKLRSIEVVKILSEEELIILGDSSRLEQVLVNLITNARDALEKNEKAVIKIKTEIENSKAIILIEDNGGGIPSETIEKIFNPFFTTKEVGKGTGLGLSISHSIIEDHKGLLTCSSQLGKGTVFKISIDLYQRP